MPTSLIKNMASVKTEHGRVLKNYGHKYANYKNDPRTRRKLLAIERAITQIPKESAMIDLITGRITIVPDKNLNASLQRLAKKEVMLVKIGEIVEVQNKTNPSMPPTRFKILEITPEVGTILIKSIGNV